MKRLFAEFASSTRGNFAMMMVLASVPVLGGVGMMVEYSNLSNNQSRLQNAVDAAALYMGKYNLENGQLPTKKDVKGFLKKNFEGNIASVAIKGKGAKSDDLILQATSRAPDFFFGNIMPAVFDQSAEASVPKSDVGSVDVALVLDTTFSMSGDNKLVDLQTTAKQFIDDLSGYSQTPGDIKIGIVPFDQHINVGMANRNASWMDVPPDQTRTVTTNQTTTTGGTQTCTTVPTMDDGVPGTRQSCTTTGGTTTTTPVTSTVTDSWHGCVGSRFAPYTFRDTAPNTRFRGLLNVWCSNEITPLNSDWAALKTEIDSLVANRDTYAAVGVMWGLRVLSPAVPFTEAAASKNPQKVMIVMADGDNTRSNSLASNDVGNWSTDGIEGDKNTKLACDAAKMDDVVIYSIAFGNSISTRGQDVLQDCASPSGGYYRAKSAADLKKAFDNILASIVRLRLTS
ncbi:MAG: TadE/TadG family type IV pilus assembly protein [Pseudomonadota bacterium]